MASTVLLASQQRQGTSQSGNFKVPDTAAGIVALRFDILAADWVDPTKSGTFRLFQLDEPSQTWQQVFAATWVGALDNDPLIRPRVQLDAARFAGKTVRAEIETSSRFRTGVTLETT